MPCGHRRGVLVQGMAADGVWLWTKGWGRDWEDIGATELRARCSMLRSEGLSLANCSLLRRLQSSSGTRGPVAGRKGASSFTLSRALFPLCSRGS